MKKLIVFMMIMLMTMCTVCFGRTYTKKQLLVIDELGEPVSHTTITSITIYNAGTSVAATLYSDKNGNTSKTNPIVTGLEDALIEFWSADADYKATVTDGTYSVTRDNMDAGTTRIGFPTYLVAMSSQTASDGQSFTFGTDSDWVLAAQDSTFDATPAVDDSAFAIGTADYTSDLYLYGGTAGYNLYWDASENTLELLDNTVLAVGTGDDYTISHDGTTTTVTGNHTVSGIPTFSTDVILDGTYDIKYDDSRYQLHFQDNAVLGIGGAEDAAGDITFVYDGTDLLMEAAAADDLWKLGATTNFDIGIYGDTATDFVYFDTSAELVYLDGFDIRFNDGDFLKFGDDSDWTIDSSTATILDIVPLTTDETSTVYLGADTAGADLKLFAATTADYVLWDASDEQIEFVGTQALFDDDSDALFGTDSDFKIESDTTKILEVIPGAATDDYSVNFGLDQTGCDVKIFGATTGEYWMYDASADSVIANTGNALYTMTDAEANQFKVDATGTVAGYAIVLETTDGGVQINADGASNGDISVDAADDLTLTAAGDLTLAVTGTYSLGGAAVTNALMNVEVVTTQTNALAATESGKVVVSSYTGTQTHTLPDAAAGLWFIFVDNSSTAADDVAIDCAAGDNIDHDTNGDAIESVTDAYPQSIMVVALNGTDWVTVGAQGTWGAQ